jgi:cysteine desulfurase family protein (TIGR01976 family)
MPLQPQLVRPHFPALALSDDGRPRVYLDNPGGTQVPQQVLDRISHYLVHTNANHGGLFRTSQESDAVLDEAHRAMADLLNAPSPDEIVFGPNMTSLTFHLSRSLAGWLKPGDEIVLTRMDHDANVSPWLRVAEERGVVVRWLDFSPETYRYSLSDLEGLLSDHTRIVAVNYASNALGTINDVQAVTEMAHAAGALVYVDAVQYVPHGPTDVQAIGCDFLVCSPYKFFGPHAGVAWSKLDLLDRLPAYRVRPAAAEPPGKFETGTQNHEGQAGTLGALEYLVWVGETQAQEYHAQYSHLGGRRQHLHAAMSAIKAYEQTLSAQLIAGLQRIPGVTVRGITDPPHMADRVPTVSFTLAGHHPADVARRLASENIYVWDGDYYAVEVIHRLGLADSGGMVRVGAAHYNTIEELDRLLDVVARLGAAA